MSDDDIVQIAIAQARSHAAAVKTGCEITEKRYGRAIDALRAAYERAQLDPQAKIPTPLTAAISVLIAISEQDKQNIYGDKAA